MKTFPWNDKALSYSRFWDSDAKGPDCFIGRTALKERLSEPSCRRFEDALADISIGMAMIMDYLEQKEPKEGSNPPSDEL